MSFNVYYSTRPRISMAMKTGERICFNGGQYVTDKKDEIEFLDYEVARGNDMIYVKKDQLTVTSDQLDPLAAIKQKAVEEYLAQQAAQQDPSRSMGTTAQSVNIATSESIKAISAGSRSK